MRAPKKSLRFIVSLHGMSAKREPLYTCWPTSSSSVSLTKMHSPEAEALVRVRVRMRVRVRVRVND